MSRLCERGSCMHIAHEAPEKELVAYYTRRISTIPTCRFKDKWVSRSAVIPSVCNGHPCLAEIVWVSHGFSDLGFEFNFFPPWAGVAQKLWGCGHFCRHEYLSDPLTYSGAVLVKLISWINKIASWPTIVSFSRKNLDLAVDMHISLVQMHQYASQGLTEGKDFRTAIQDAIELVQKERAASGVPCLRCRVDVHTESLPCVNQFVGFA